ncbi:hypothetical protein V5799_025820 [Amblyomma americanum]|uniref:Uncharacterized protein n=1 Tax=Amblyomma americanum TaxID=6943 RepID=A0AAQ4E8J8_AMBAM
MRLYFHLFQNSAYSKHGTLFPNQSRFSPSKTPQVVSPDVLHKSQILILHHSREYALEPCGKAFMSMPEIHAASTDQITGHSSNLENLLNIVSQLSTGAL